MACLQKYVKTCLIVIKDIFKVTSDLSRPLPLRSMSYVLSRLPNKQYERGASFRTMVHLLSSPSCHDLCTLDEDFDATESAIRVFKYYEN